MKQLTTQLITGKPLLMIYQFIKNFKNLTRGHFFTVNLVEPNGRQLKIFYNSSEKRVPYKWEKSIKKVIKSTYYT